jgi:Domain of unknown function (DUF6867)
MLGFYDTPLPAFIIITVVLGGGAAWLTGRAVSQSWQPIWKVGVYMLLLAAAVRFLHYALAKGTPPATLASADAGKLLWYYFVDYVVLIIFAALSYRIARAAQMTTQYPWLYRRTGPLSWEDRKGDG